MLSGLDYTIYYYCIKRILKRELIYRKIRPMNNVNVRYATRIDAREITELQIACWKSTYRGILPDYLLDKSQEQVESGIVNREKRIAEGDNLGWPNIVAEYDNRIIGWVAGGLNQNPAFPYEVDLQAIYILKEFQKQGIGRIMVKAFAKLMLYNGTSSMIIWVLKDNCNAIQFYSRLGGKIIGEKMFLDTYPLIGFGWEDVSGLLY